MKERKHADIVAAVKSKRNLGLSQHLHGSAWQAEEFALGHVEDLGEARVRRHYVSGDGNNSALPQRVRDRPRKPVDYVPSGLGCPIYKPDDTATRLQGRAG